MNNKLILKAFADRTGICLILVHHTRKQKSDDNFDRISGTNGLLGAADGAFIMYKSKRTDGDATIEVSGRDQADKKYQITRNKETLCWDFKSAQSCTLDEPPEPLIEAVGNFINADNPTWEGTATELIEKLELDVKPNVLSLKLNVNAGKLYNLYFVQYTNKRTHKGRHIYLKYDGEHPVMVIPEPIQEVQKNDISANEVEDDNAKPLFEDISNEALNAMIDSCL